MVVPRGSKVGEGLPSADTGRGYGVGSKTSQGAAPVTGAIALTLQFQPRLSFEKVDELQELRRGD